METTRVYRETMQAIASGYRYVSNRGGTRSGKTYGNLQVLADIHYNARMDIGVTSVVSETLPHLKRGAIRDFFSVMAEMGVWNETRWNKTENLYTFPNGSILEFFGADAVGKVQGPSRRRLFVNEIQNMSFETVRQLLTRTTDFVLMDYNPTHWFFVNEKYETRKNCKTIVTTYEDNPFLTAEQIAEIESYRSDGGWWRVYGKGEIGQLEGVIFDFEQIDSLPSGDEATSLVEVWGMDFGFTNDPTAIVRVLADTRRKIAWIEEVAYRTGMDNDAIAARCLEAGAKPATEIFADCAEPKSISEIRKKGLNIKACDKTAPSSERIKFQIDWEKGWKFMVTKDSVDVIKEMRGYTWAKDKDGNSLNIPIDVMNHACDAIRYALWSKFARNGGNYIFHMKDR